MNTLLKKQNIVLVLCLFFTLGLFAQGDYNALEFIENKGQWEPGIVFKGVLGNGAFFLHKTGFTIVQHNTDDLKRMADEHHGSLDAGNDKHGAAPAALKSGKPGPGDPGPGNPEKPGIDFLRSHAYSLTFKGANANPVVIPGNPEPTYNNYFIGNDSTKWAGGCRIFLSVTYKDVYPGIDVKYYSESGSLKYEFIVHPGADPDRISMEIRGADKLAVKKNELIISTSVGEAKELSPYTYQYVGKDRQKIDCRFSLKDSTVKFSIKNYNKHHTLVIDPTLIFASFTGSKGDNWGYTATYGPDGTFFAGGIVFATGFPVSPGAYQSNFRAGSNSSSSSFWNMGIMRFSANGSQRVYATYIGGDKQDQPHSLFSDDRGNLVIAGRTSSGNYPLVSDLKFGVQGGWDIVVTKLNAAGTALIGSCRIGGSGDDGFNTADSHTGSARDLLNNYGDDARSEVVLDRFNNVYVASCTQSNNFFVTGNAAQSTFGGVQDAVLLKLNPNLSSILYSSYLGGSGYDAGFVLALNPLNSDIYMAGGTTSPNFPGNKSGSYQPNYMGGRSDGFVAVYSNDGTTLRQTTHLGTTGTDIVFGIQFDKFGFPYVMGTTTGSWPVTNVAYSNPNSKQYISKLRKDLSGFEYSTVFGTGSALPNISPVAFLVDRCENIYVSGWGKSFTANYQLDPITGMPVTSDAIKRVADQIDFYFIVLERNSNSLLYGTFYGQNNGTGDHVDGGTSRFDENGVIYQAICACSFVSSGPKPRWPTTPGAWCCPSGTTPSTSGSQCNLAALKIAFNYAGVGSGVRAFINGVFDTTGCIPLNVTFRDTIRNAQSYEWNFGDGSPEVITTSFEQMHVYNQVGTYQVRLIAVDSTTCNIRDTSYLSVIVRDDAAVLDFNSVKLPPCESLTYRFENLSTAPANKPFQPQSFIWDFGDGTRLVPGPNSVQHTFASAGTYKVRLILPDTNYCNSPDSLVRELRVSPLVKAQFEVPLAICAPSTVVFNNTSLAGQTFSWDFGDGTTSTSINPTHVYTTPGTYVVKMKAFDPATCNLEDSTQATIVVSSKPTAQFTFTPVQPAENTPNIFTNISSPDAIRFKWLFGDGDSLVTTSRADVEHQYNATGTFEACLIAINQNGCEDTTCQFVETIVMPRLDVPNAFTPLGPVQASKIFVRGFAIGKMRFTIYNRLGQQVFVGTDQSQGWDGRFKGVLQPMDVYAYTLEVEFTDGTRASKKGDITLIR